MNTDINSTTDIRMTDISVFGRSYEQVHGEGSHIITQQEIREACRPLSEEEKKKRAGQKYFDWHKRADLDGEQKFYLCKKCGTLVGMLNDSSASVKCCGSDMDRLEAVSRGHVGVRTDGDQVYVDFSRVPHTVGHDHHIGWAYIKTAMGGQRRILYPDMKPEVKFTLNDGDEFQSAFVYCSRHGLWSSSSESELN